MNLWRCCHRFLGHAPMKSLKRTSLPVRQTWLVVERVGWDFTSTDLKSSRQVDDKARQEVNQWFTLCLSSPHSGQNGLVDGSRMHGVDNWLEESWTDNFRSVHLFAVHGFSSVDIAHAVSSCQIVCCSSCVYMQSCAHTIPCDSGEHYVTDQPAGALLLSVSVETMFICNTDLLTYRRYMLTNCAARVVLQAPRRSHTKPLVR